MSLASFVLIQLTLVIAVGCSTKGDLPEDRTGSPTTFEIDGLSAPVRVVRDRYGIPHIYAHSRDDLFAAQGFVQAQDRLFQMDLWRRSVQGRLSEVLGANFIERDAMTRRVQYRGDHASEWASYGGDAKPAAEAFVRGVNAAVARARAQLPESFELAGWTPDVWQAEDLLNRTDAFLSGGDALEEVARAGMSSVVADAIRRIGAPPFFSLLSRGVRLQADHGIGDRELPSPLAYAPTMAGGAELRDDGVLVAGESAQRYEHPSLRYLVHLNAPGVNVIGATAPWRPGVAIGHNDRFAWAPSPIRVDTQDVRDVPNGVTTQTIHDSIAVKGRTEPFEYDTELTPRGVVIASDRERGRKYVLAWRGFEPGWAPELASVAVDRARTPEEFDAAAATWRAPAAKLVSSRVGQVSRVGQAGAARPDNAPRVSRAMFAHPLAITRAARERFNAGPVARPDDDRPVRLLLDPRAWDNSRAIAVPGQSESPGSLHFADLVKPWSLGELVPLLFSDEAVKANAESTAMLVPKPRP